jgi:hypothetical protein
VQHVKLLRRSKVHNGFHFKKGLNVLREQFDPSPTCGGGGLYYCKKSDIIHWLHIYDDLGWLADVENPPDAKVVKMPNKLKADKIILSNFRRITQETLIQSFPEAQFMKWLKASYYYALPILKKRKLREWLATKSEGFHLKAVRANPHYILYLPQASLTERICLTVIKYLTHEFKKIGWNSSTENRWLDTNTFEIINICLSFNGLLIKELPCISAKYLEEMNKNPIDLNVGKYFILKDAKFMEVAVKQNPLALHSVNPVILTDEHIKNFLHLNTRYIKYLPKERLTPTLLNQTMSLILDAKNPRGFRVIARRDL